MEKNLSIVRQRISVKNQVFRSAVLATVFALFFIGYTTAQTCGFANFKFERVQATINPLVGGFLWKKPSDYDVNTTKYYPTIIYWHGSGSIGTGTPSQLCNIVQHPFGGNPDDALPIAIQDGTAILTVTQGSTTYEYMVFCPQYSQYTYNPSFPDVFYPTAGTAAAAVQYFIDHYRVDINRIYMTGMSSGANIAMEYAAASTANSNKIAALAPTALCSINVQGGGNIATTNLPVWINHCTADSRCPPVSAQGWVSQINNSIPAPGVPAKLTLMTNNGVSCNFVDAHNAWPNVYRSSYNVDGTNLFQWMIQYQRNLTVPVKLESYNARLSNGKVYLNWATSREVSASSFTIEKAGADQRYVEFKTVKANGNSNQLNNYSLIDDNPASGLNYYRLVQTDVDNKRTVFETRKVMDSRGRSVKVVVLPNPVKDEVTTFINLSKSQRVTITISDMNGKVLRTRTAVYGEGNTGITIPVTELSKGVYFVRTAGEDFSDVQKIIKQ